MPKSKTTNLKRKEFEDFQEKIINLFEKQNKNLKGIVDIIRKLTDRDKSLFRELISLNKSLVYLILSVGIFAILWDKITESWVEVFGFIKHLYAQTSPDTRWQTLIIIPFTAILTLIGKYSYDKLKEKKK